MWKICTFEIFKLKFMDSKKYDCFPAFIGYLKELQIM